MTATETVQQPPATLTVFVAGRPAPQGSKTRTRFGIRDANGQALHPWRDAVRADVATQLPEWWTPVTGPVGIGLTFYLPKPASAPKRKRTWPIAARSGDIDKLVRACLDAISDAGWWKNDSQVVVLHATKDYGDRTGVEITLWEGPE